jgi:hypothetical protein
MSKTTIEITSCFLTYTEKGVLKDEEGNALAEYFPIGSELQRIDVLHLRGDDPLRKQAMRYIKARQKVIRELEEMIAQELERVDE